MKENILISLKNIVVEFDGQRILKGINLDIHDEEFVTFLGPSGCGKTTTLRIIGGFVEPNQGEIYFDGKKINGVPPYKRNVNTVFQRYALFPHLNVFDNVAFGLNIKKMDKKVIEQKVRSMLKMVGLVGFENRNINQLSGGQQQRVAIARALVNEMQGELMRIQKSLKITFIYVTHDQEEALTMSDRVVVMKDGEIQQIGTPQDIYNEPKNAFVADFIGESNIIDGVMYEDFEVEFAGQAFKCVDKGFAENERVDVVIRPEDIIVGDYETSPISGEVESVIFKGVHYEITVDAHGYKWLIHSTQSQPVGAHIGMNVRPEDIHIMKKMEAKAR